MSNAIIEDVTDYTTPRECEVCGTPTERRTRCTNGRCLKCHRAHCTPGGVTSPGHARRWPEGTKDCTKCRGKIPRPELAPGEDELCARCVDYLARMREVERG
jgi:hypothetical protein